MLLSLLLLGLTNKDTSGVTPIDTEMKAKRDNIISELITLRITKAKAKEIWGGGGGRMKFTLSSLSCKNIDWN